MYHVELDHILSEDDAVQRIRDLVAQVERDGEIYVITSGGRPAVALIKADQLGTLGQPSAESTSAQSSMNLSSAPAAHNSEPASPPAPATSPQFAAATAPDPGSSSPLSEPLDETQSNLPPIFGMKALDQATPAPTTPPPVATQPDFPATPPQPATNLNPTQAGFSLPPLPEMPEDPTNNSPLS